MQSWILMIITYDGQSMLFCFVPFRSKRMYVMVRTLPRIAFPLPWVPNLQLGHAIVVNPTPVTEKGENPDLFHCAVSSGAWEQIPTRLTDS